MQIFYSPSTGGFYNTDIHESLFVLHVDTDPDSGVTTAEYLVPDPDGPIADAIEITVDEHRALFEAQAQGSTIQADANGRPVAVAPPAPTLADVAAAISVDVQRWLDGTVKVNGYDSLASCISYRGSSVAQWNADAVAALAWRDAVWQAAFQWQQDALASPPATFPASAEVIAQLPQPETFGWVTHQPGAAA